jgi:hypothetical protein
MHTELSLRGKLLIVAFTVLGFLGLILLINQISLGNQRVLQVDDDVQVGAVVSACQFELTVYPEKRIPATGNWSTQLTVDIYNTSDVYQDSFTATSNSLGVANVDICAQGVNLPPGNYNFRIRGFSHLRREFANYPAFQNQFTSIDFTTGSEVLFAGETSNVYDNYINSLDLSTQINALYSASVKNDLNRDGVVNSLDISNTLFNFFDTGD